MKIAHLFLVRDGLNHEPVWQRFFRGHEAQWTAYVHAKWPQQVTSDWLRSKLIARHCETEWGRVSLVQAELLLLEAALQDEQNQFFLLHSESCVPLRSFEYVYRILFTGQRSWLSFNRGNPERYKYIDPSAIPREHFYKSSQWFCLSRSHAEFLVEKTELRHWRHADCPDEHWIATLLAMHGKLDECLDRRLTFADWRGTLQSPVTFHDLSPEHVKSLQGRELFARKFAVDSNVGDYMPLVVPTPDLVNVAYGPHAQQGLDLWIAKAAQPTALVVYIHGGGFRAESKAEINPVLLQGLIERGISVAAINYRFAPGERLLPLYLDAARAIQFARHNANAWHIDPQRIGATGESVGAGASLWLGFHADLADPARDDAVLRESSRLRCLAVNDAQSSYDPRVIRDWIGDATARHPVLAGFCGLQSAELETPEAHRRFEAASPITHLTKDAPPVLAFYSAPRGPVPPNAQPGMGFRHINFGLKLKERMDALGLSCTIRHRDEGANVVRETIDFFVKYLQSPG